MKVCPRPLRRRSSALLTETLEPTPLVEPSAVCAQKIEVTSDQTGRRGGGAARAAPAALPPPAPFLGNHRGATPVVVPNLAGALELAILVEALELVVALELAMLMEALEQPALVQGSPSACTRSPFSRA